MGKRPHIITVTGVPATGKSNFASRLQKALRRYDIAAECIELNDVVNKYHTYHSIDALGAKIVDEEELTTWVKKEISMMHKNGTTLFILVGHLAPELLMRYDLAIVTRQNLQGLARRMRLRKYPREKIKENVVAEVLDYCGTGVAEMSDETYEVESETDKKAAVRYILAAAMGGRAKKPKSTRKVRIGELLKFIKTNKGLGL
jgi:broad-specificity NMP kinase